MPSILALVQRCLNVLRGRITQDEGINAGRGGHGDVEGVQAIAGGDQFTFLEILVRAGYEPDNPKPERIFEFLAQLITFYFKSSCSVPIQ